MNQSNIAVVIYATRTEAEAEAAMTDLKQSGFNMKKLSIVGGNYHLNYQTAPKTDKFVVIAHGTEAEVAQARDVIATRSTGVSL